MDADFSVELGQDDPALEMPWTDPDGRLQYHDLRRNPEALLLLDEATSYQELGEFLAATNSSRSILESAKCDAWAASELDESEDVYGATVKCVSYVDLLFCDDGRRFDFDAHESFAERVVELLGRAPEVSASVEIIIRRCYYTAEDGTDQGESRAGFYYTVYVSGYGDDPDDARTRWGIGLKLVQNALLQLSAESGSRN